MSAPPLLARALALAVTAHDGQRRKASREPYVVHPLRVVGRLYEWGVRDADVLAAAALHDVLEDTDYLRETMEREFGARVTRIVAALTHAAGLPPKERQQQILASLEKADLEAVLVKVADRLDNVLDMPAWRPGSKAGYLAESVEIGKLAAARLAGASDESETASALRKALAEFDRAVGARLVEAQRAAARESG